jgi:drug/metabolite transporter (DMT)-like permease
MTNDTHHAHRLRALIEATLAVIIWAASFIATKIALREVSQYTVVWLRFGMGVVILGAIVVARKEFRLPSVRSLGDFALLGVVGITIHQWLQATGLKTALASTTAWLVSTSPIVIALIGRFLLQERLSRKRILGIGLATLGVLLVIGRGDWKGVLSGSFGVMGDLLVALSAITWAVFTVLSRRGLRQHSAVFMMFWVMLAGWIACTIAWTITGGLAVPLHMSMEGWIAVVFLGVFCSALAYLFWYNALTYLPASQAGSLLYLEPLFTLVIAALLLGERIVLSGIVGGVVILVGVWLVTGGTGRLRRKPTASIGTSTAEEHSRRDATMHTSARKN